MATIDYSCFLMVEIVKKFSSETLSSKDFQHSTNNVCEILYKDSLFRLDPAATSIQVGLHY